MTSSESEDPRRRSEDDRGDTLFVAEEDDGRRQERIRSERTAPSESEDPRRRPEDDRGDTLFVAEEDDGRRQERIRSERTAPSESEDPRRRPEDDRGDTLFVAEEDDGRRQERIRSERTKWPLWEVFVRPRRGLSHTHVGSLHAPDAEMALQNARDVFTRRGEGVSIWVVPSVQIAASSPAEKDRYFDPAADKVYRHPTFYELPEEVRQL